MSMKTLFGFCLVLMCFLIRPGLAQVPEPAECLIYDLYVLIREPNTDVSHCWSDCFGEPDCHMAVVVKPLLGSYHCLLVNCLNQGEYSYPKDPSARIYVYPKNTINDEQRDYLVDRKYGLANERLRCHDSMNFSSCQTGFPKFFYNSTSYRCEIFYNACGTSRNVFDTRAGCEAICNETFRCYRPVERGRCEAQMSKFFYNISSGRCEAFTFTGCGSNGNIFPSMEACQSLCANVTAATPSQLAMDLGFTLPALTKKEILFVVFPAVCSVLMVTLIIVIIVKLRGGSIGYVKVQ